MIGRKREEEVAKVAEDARDTDVVETETQPEPPARTASEDVRIIQEMLKQLLPTAQEDPVSISRIPEHCAAIMSAALNLEWFGHTGGKQPPGKEHATNVIAVRIFNLDMTLAEFFEKVRGILQRVEK